ncbi:hypothetical protein QHF83_25220 [Polyangium sp. 15x6]|nr:hypothetical protein [Polyangium sp. 15x6]
MIVALALLLGRAGRAEAAMMKHHDLVSLALESDHIVLATRTGERKSAPYSTGIDHVVKKAYRGTLAPNDAVQVDYGGYELNPVILRLPGAPSADVILFLKRFDEKAERAPGMLEHYLVPSGLRIFIDGRAYRFEQGWNPGPYVPVPQGPDPFDVAGDPRGGSEPLTLAELERALERAITRADHVRALLRDPSPNVAALAAEVGPEDTRDFDGLVVNPFSGWEDLVATRSLQAIATTNDAESFCDALGRAQGVNLLELRQKVDKARILDIATNRAASPRARVAAIELSQYFWGPRSFMESMSRRIASLLDDPDARVRAAAAGAVNTREPDAKISGAAIVARWPLEGDDAVRYAMVRSAIALGILGQLDTTRAPSPVMSGSLRGRALHLRWVSYDGSPWRVDRGEITLKSSTGERRMPMDMGGWGYAGDGSLGILLAFDPPLDPGVYKVELMARMTSAQDHQDRRIALGELLVTDPNPRTAPANQPATSGEEPVEPPRVPKRSACACDLASTDDDMDTFGLAAIAVAIAALRRRPPGARGRPHPPR